MPHPNQEIADLIEQQCDRYAIGRRFLRDNHGQETQERELLRLNLEQFADRLAVIGAAQ